MARRKDGRWMQASRRLLRFRPLLAAALSAALLVPLVALLVHSCASPPPPRPAPPGTPSPPSPDLRVLLATGRKRAELGWQGPAILARADRGERRALPAGGTLTVVSTPAGLDTGSGGADERLLVAGGDDTVFLLDGRRYEGDLSFSWKPGEGIQIVNRVDLETYLLGVLGGEMPASWPLEALKAQAVAARTYAVFETSRGRRPAFDLFDDTRSQVYIGLPGGPHAGRIREAVRDTRGEILVHRGRPVHAFFHSTCGGHTESASRVFGTAGIPPLRGVPCGACDASPAFRWEAEMPKKTLARSLGLAGVKEIRAVEPGPSGRCRRVAVRAAGGERVFPAGDFRRKVGTTVLKSTAFEAEILEETVRFRGRGFGHGVGLCQWGARGLAKRGKGHLEILEHYYPGAVILQAAAVCGGG